MSHIKTVTDSTFQSEVLDREKPVLVDFWAQWCGPCRAVASVLDKVAEENAGVIEVVKVNVDENPQSTAEYGIVSIPAMLIFHRGEVAKRLVGAKPKHLIAAELAEFLT